jgi:hypothetical protein
MASDVLKAPSPSLRGGLPSNRHLLETLLCAFADTPSGDDLADFGLAPEEALNALVGQQV